MRLEQRARGEQRLRRRRLWCLSQKPSSACGLRPRRPPPQDAEVTLGSDPQAARPVSSVVMASYWANGCTHPHENQQRDMWCMYIFNFVCSRVFCELVLQESIFIKKDKTEELI